MKIHRVKCDIRWFAEFTAGSKQFEIRGNDRDYKVGDLLELNETRDAEYTGRAALYKITSVLPDTDFPDCIKSGFAVIGIQPVTGVYDDYGKGALT